MQEIPLMRTGLLLLAATAVVAGLSMLVSPSRRNDGGGDRDESALAAADTPVTARPADSAAAQGAFACRVDTAGVALPDAVHESSGLALSGGGDALWTHNDSGEPVLHLVGT
ncbi:MAG TPA: hypothetical protein VFR37_12255, partial [Longimicrobium sp.]|nr:hypothetical protein [Longimicrobium sp.]